MSNAILKGPEKAEWRRASRVTDDLPQTGAEALFNVTGGRVWVKLILGEVTTAIQNQANATKLVSNPTVGTSGDISATLDIAADEVGTLYFPEGDATALIGANAGTGFAANGINPFIVPVGSIDLDCAASNTGKVKWDIWYVPLDEGARVHATSV